MVEVLTMGEPLVVFIADQKGELKDVEKFTKALAGAELNVSIGLSRLGHSVSYITKAGSDPFGENVKDCLVNENIDLSNVITDGNLLTGFYLKSKVDEGDPSIFYYRKNSAASFLNEEDVKHIDFTGVKLLHVTGISLALSESCLKAQQELIKKAHDNGTLVCFDPNIRKQLWKSEDDMIKTINEIAFKSDYVLPGIEEGKLLTGLEKPEEIADFYLKYRAKVIIIKLGKAGAFVKTKNQSFYVKGYKVEHVVDTVGAGDGFAVGVISGVLEGMSLIDAVKRGNAIGAIATTFKGDNSGLPNREELLRFMNMNKM